MTNHLPYHVLNINENPISVCCYIDTSTYTKIAFVTNENSLRSGVSISIFTLYVFVIHNFYSEDTPHMQAQIPVMINSRYAN